MLKNLRLGFPYLNAQFVSPNSSQKCRTQLSLNKKEINQITAFHVSVKERKWSARLINTIKNYPKIETNLLEWVV